MHSEGLTNFINCGIIYTIQRFGDVSKQVILVLVRLFVFYYLLKGEFAMYDVVIIGAGVVGGVLARELSRYDVKICILDKERDVAMGASKANSGIVHAGFDAKPGSLKAQLNVRGAKLMPKLAQELGVKYINNGAIVIGFNQEDYLTIKDLYERGITNGVEKLEILNKEKLKKIEPNISEEVTCALYAPTSSIICPYELTIASVGNAMDNGTELKLDFNVEKIEETATGYVVKSDIDSVEGRFVINAAGLYSDAVAEMVGDNSISIKPRSGEYMLLDKECGHIVKQTVFRTPSKMGKGILVSPTVDGNLLLGPTSTDVEDKTDKKTTLAGLNEVITSAKEDVANIPFGKVITSFTGLRAHGNTDDFIINSPKHGFVNAAGIESPGLTASPAIAEYIIDILKKQGLVMNKKEGFNPIRKAMHAFREADIKEKNEIIKKDPSFGKVVCRCETVTEGEILQAIRTNPKPTDLDGVKRRTRAQMGRCQGGFCSPYVTELLAKELSVPYESVTKFGGKSIVNIRKTKEV